MTTRKNKRKLEEKGFVILFSMMVSLIILLITAGMFLLARKRSIITAYTKEAQRAFYAANSALECGLYYDISPYIEKTKFPIDVGEDYTATFTCGGRTIETRKLNLSETGGGYDMAFSFRYPILEEDAFNLNLVDPTGCAYVLVEKKLGEDLGDGLREIRTRITAVGFNTCKRNSSDGLYDLPNFDDPKLLERRISSTYTTYYQQ